MKHPELSEAELAALAFCDRFLRSFDTRLRAIEDKVEAIFRIYKGGGMQSRETEATDTKSG